MVQEPVRDARLLGDVADARGVVAVAGEDAHGRVEDQAPLPSRLRRLNGQSTSLAL